MPAPEVAAAGLSRLAVFGYASLVSPASASHTLGRPVAPIPARLRGWTRAWSLARDNRTSEKTFARPDGSEPAYCLGLNLEPAPAGPHPNGALIELDDAELERLDLREIRYRRVEVTDSVSAADPRAAGLDLVYAYVARAEHYRPVAPADAIIVANYRGDGRGCVRRARSGRARSVSRHDRAAAGRGDRGDPGPRPDPARKSPKLVDNCPRCYRGSALGRFPRRKDAMAEQPSTVVISDLGALRVAVVDGEVDMASADHFERAMFKSLAAAHLIVDLAACTFLDSSGLRALVSASRQADRLGHQMVIARPSQRVTQLLELTGIIAAIPIFDELEQAKLELGSASR